jgi:hypothetical protein
MEVACRRQYFKRAVEQHENHEFVKWRYIIRASNPVTVFLPVKNTPYICDRCF